MNDNLTESAYRVIFENSAVAITLADEEGRIVLWNKFTEEMLFKKPDELRMLQVESLYPPEEWRRMRSENIRQKGMQHHFETRMLRGDGRAVDVDISISVLKDAAGRITGSIGVIRDISERKAAEALIRRAKEAADAANRTKGAFLYKLAQEAVAPASALVDSIERGEVEKAKQTAARLKSLVDDMYRVFQELKDEKFLKVD